MVARRDGARDLGDQTSVKLEIGLETATASSARRKGGYRSFPRFRARRWIPNDVAKENWGSGRDRNGSGGNSGGPECHGQCVFDTTFTPTSQFTWRAPVYSSRDPYGKVIAWLWGRSKEELEGVMSDAIYEWGASNTGVDQIADLHARGGDPLNVFPTMARAPGDPYVGGFASKNRNSIWINVNEPLKGYMDASGNRAQFTLGQVVTHEVGHHVGGYWSRKDAPDDVRYEVNVIRNYDNRYLAERGLPHRVECYGNRGGPGSC